MTKKVTLIVLSIVIVAAAVTGVYFYKTSDSTNSTASTQSTEQTEINSTELSSAPQPTQVITEADSTFEPSTENIADNTKEVQTTNFTIQKVIDHTTNEETSPRVAFGSSFNKNDCYINFGTDGKFELYFNIYADNGANTGTYTESGDIITVSYDNGKTAEYDIVRNSDGIISYIIITYGDYDVYFS